jgi:two-component system sensor histidine kinase YesM
MAARENAADAAKLIKALADYFRVSLSSGRDIITLEEEERMVCAYLTIQAERYDHEFQVEWDVSQAALSCLLPKLTLQPLVENALLHGLRKRQEETGALLRIEAGVSGGTLTMRVMDNGTGFTQEARAAFGSPAGGASLPEGGGYGLNNVRERLRLFSGGKYQFFLEEGLPGFTTLTVKLELHTISK